MEIENVRENIASGKPLFVINRTTGDKIEVVWELSGRTKDILLAGGLLNYTKTQG